MLVLVILLVVTNIVTLGVLARILLRPAAQPAPDEKLARAVSAAAGASSSSSGTRRVITIEVLNPIELAGTRGRLVGIAGSLAPGITRRLVYDQVLKILRRQLADERVVADVRLMVVRPELLRDGGAPGASAPGLDAPAADVPAADVPAAQTVTRTVVRPDGAEREDAGGPSA